LDLGTASIRTAIVRAIAVAGVSAILTLTFSGHVLGAEEDLDQPIELAAGVIYGVTLFNVAGTSSFPAESRATSIAKRIVGIASNVSFDPSALKVVPIDDGRAIFAGAIRVMVVTAADADICLLPPPDLSSDGALQLHCALWLELGRERRGSYFREYSQAAG
jgi:hypothetical protein